MPKLLDILLQRNDSEVPWGFQVQGGLDHGSQPVISSVTFGTLAAQYLNAGDKILEIENQKGHSLLLSEINRILHEDNSTLRLLVEKLPPAATAIKNRVSTAPKAENSVVATVSEPYEVVSEHEWIKEKQKSANGTKQSTKIWLREANRDPSLGEYDLELNFESTKYREKGDSKFEDYKNDWNVSRNQKRMQMMSENFEKIFRDKIGEWLELNMLNGPSRKQQSNSSPAADGSQSGQFPPPPPPPAFPGTLSGRRLKTEIPERGLEPPSVIQNAMMTKDKKPFTYTPGGIDLSEIRSPKMQRRINRNACADEMPGIPAPTTNQSPPVAPSTNTQFSAMQSQLPAQVLPPVGAVPPPPPPPPSNNTETMPASIPPAPPAPSAPTSKPTGGRPPLGFDPNELLARVNKSQPYVPSASNREEPVRNFKAQPAEEKSNFEPKQQKSNEIGQNIHVPLQNEPGHIYVPQVTPKVQSEASSPYAPLPASHPSRGNLGSLYIPPVTGGTNQDQSAPSSSSPFGYKAQHNSPSVASPPVETKPQAPWVTVYKTPQSSVPWANRETESPKPAGTRIIPIQIEGRDSPKPTTPSPQPQSAAPPPFLQSQQMRQAQTQQPARQPPSPQAQLPNTRVIPIQIEGSSQPAANQQPRSPGQTFNQNKFNPMTPQSPTPFSPSQEKDQKPQWAPVQPRSFKKEPEMIQQRPQQTHDINRPQQPQPEYGTYNTAGVPLSQLRKMQLSDDDRALMDKFKSQVERQGNEILNDENSNPRYRGGYIPSKVFRALDDSVDDEKYLHNESDPRYRGACIPSRAFRMLQCMTDTAGEMTQQVPKSQLRGPAGRPLSGSQFQQDSPTGPYVPPSEQQAQEPRKYTGSSIPSRSFRMLQQMTGQEVSAPTGPPSGRETPVSGVNRWCPSPSPSPIDPFWGFYPPDPYLIYNYISDLNAAYGFPPPPPPTAFAQPPPLHPSYYQVYQNYSSDNDEQGYSSTDELAQYYSNYRRMFGYSPYTPNPERYSTPNSFNTPHGCVTPVPGKKKDHIKKPNKSNLKEEKKYQNEMMTGTNVQTNEEISSSTDDESGSDTEVEDEDSNKTNSLQTLKSVPNVNVYTSESSSNVVYSEEEEVSSSEEEEEVVEVKEEPVPHQLSVIFEESEHSDVESFKRSEDSRGCSSAISESESCSTLDNEDDDSENDVMDAESSVTVRLPLKLQFSRSDDNEGITTVIVGDSQIERDTMYNLNMIKESEPVLEEESYDSDDADVSVTFTLPSRSNSVISVEHNNSDSKGEEIYKKDEVKSEKPDIQTEVTVRLPISRSSELKDEKITEKKTALCESPPVEDDSSSTSVQSGDTVLKHKEDTDEDSEDEKLKHESFQSRIEKENNKGCEKMRKTDENEMIVEHDSYTTGVERLEEMISSFLETAKDTMSSSMELFDKNNESKVSDSATPLLKKDSQEESEEDDSGVTSDMSIKQMNSETDAEIESDYSELSKMTKFQRASTHSRLFKLLQEECERCGNELEDKDGATCAEPKENNSEENLSVRKQKLTLPLNPNFTNEAESLSSSSGIASPCSPTISDRLVKELIHSLLNKKKGKKFRKLPLAKLHAAALRILQEEIDNYDTSPTSGDDGLILSPMQTKHLHSKLTAKFVDSNGVEAQYLGPESMYGKNYYDYLDYYNTWGDPEMYSPEDYDIVPSRAFRMLREQTCSPKPIEKFTARCPRVSSKKNIQEPSTERKTPVMKSQEPDVDPQYERMTFAQKQEKVSQVLEKSVKS